VKGKKEGKMLNETQFLIKKLSDMIRKQAEREIWKAIGTESEWTDLIQCNYISLKMEILSELIKDCK
jgi:hypothetical protein